MNEQTEIWRNWIIWDLTHQWVATQNCHSHQESRIFCSKKNLKWISIVLETDLALKCPWAVNLMLISKLKAFSWGQCWILSMVWKLKNFYPKLKKKRKLIHNSIFNKMCFKFLLRSNKWAKDKMKLPEFLFR
jgi:hypothetical protein